MFILNSRLTDRKANMKKLFISQPMKDKTDEEIKAIRAKIIADASKLINDDIEIIDSFF